MWSCDGNGVYDNTGFRLRGHQFTGADGSFAFETVKPRDYRDFGIHRTPHFHVKVQGRETPLLTTQLFFPGEKLNGRTTSSGKTCCWSSGGAPRANWTRGSSSCCRLREAPFRAGGSGRGPDDGTS